VCDTLSCRKIVITGKHSIPTLEKESTMSPQSRVAKWLGVSIVAVLAILAAGTALAEAGALDGKQFAGEIGEKGKAKGDPELFVFTAEVFDPVYCHQYGFHAAPYTTREEGDRVLFQSEAKSDEQGTMHWQGTLQGSALTGTVVWSKVGQPPVEYWFKGTLEK
jgi:hypothetical protein